MERSGKQRRHRFLKAELAVLVCLLCFWAVRSGSDVIGGVIRRFQGPGEVQAIAVSDGAESFILIDGEVAYEGSVVNGYKIKEVRSDEVTFEKDGKVFVQTTPQASASVKSTSDDAKPELSSSNKDGHRFTKNLYGFFRRHHVLIPTSIYLVIGVFGTCFICLRRNHY